MRGYEIVTKKDLESMFDLLALYFPKHERPTGKNVSAWTLVLEPYTPEEVKRAVTEHLRTSKFYPAPQEIAMLCNRGRPEPNAALETSQASYSPADIEAVHELCERYKKYQNTLHEHGLMTAVEAKYNGIPYRDWCKMVKDVEVPRL